MQLRWRLAPVPGTSSFATGDLEYSRWLRKANPAPYDVTFVLYREHFFETSGRMMSNRKTLTIFRE